jgi:hypothetical protein
LTKARPGPEPLLHPQVLKLIISSIRNKLTVIDRMRKELTGRKRVINRI